MTIEERVRKIGGKALVALGVFFGLGFTIGFLVGFGYGHVTPSPLPEGTRQIAEKGKGAVSTDVPRSGIRQGAPPLAASEDNIELDNLVSIKDGEFELINHELNDDENGIYISGTVANRSKNAFDAAQIVFELCDTRGKPFTTISDRTTERMDPGDLWGFVVYIPYTDLRSMDSYRLQGIMGVRK